MRQVMTGIYIFKCNAYNTACHSSIGVTPFEAHFGRPAATVADVVLNNKLPHGTDPRRIHEFTLATFENAERIQKQISHTKMLAQEKYKFQYDKNIGYHPERFRIGGLVKIINFNVRSVHSKAWEPKFLSPFRIVRVFSIDHNDITYEISDGTSCRVVHYNRLERYFPRVDEKIILGCFPVFNNNDYSFDQKTSHVVSKALEQNMVTIDFSLAKRLSSKRSEIATNLIGIPAVIENQLESINNDVLIGPNQLIGNNENLMLEPTVPIVPVTISNQATVISLITDVSPEDVPLNRSPSVSSMEDLVSEPNFELHNINALRNELEIGSDTIAIPDMNAISHDDTLTTNQPRFLRSSSFAGSSGITGCPMSTPGQGDLVREKPKFKCLGCSKLFVGLKIHQSKCEPWKQLVLRNDSTESDPTITEQYSSANEGC
jgi:hypothetical protein